MGREGFLARFLNRFPRVVEVPSIDPRLEEEKSMLTQNVARYNSAVERLAVLPLDARSDMRIAIKAIMAVQRIEDDLLWRHALIEEGFSPVRAQELNDLKDQADTEIEITEPKFPPSF